MQWTYGGQGHEYLYRAVPHPGGGFILAGEVRSDEMVGFLRRVNKFGEGPDELREISNVCDGKKPGNGAAARTVQMSLHARGFDVSVDGLWNPGAVKSFERFRVDGGCDQSFNATAK